MDEVDFRTMVEELRKEGYIVLKEDPQYYEYGADVDTSYDAVHIEGDNYNGNKMLNLGDLAIDKLLKCYRFDTVLDIGCGEGIQSNIFINNGKTVTSIDYGDSDYFKSNKKNKGETIIADFNTYDFKGIQYDCVWCSHILEHQLNVNIFLRKVNSVLKEGGVLAITVPPLKHAIVGGHVTLWNAGLLLYNLVLAGFDCSEASIKTYGYNISVIVKKKTIENVLSMISFDRGDIRKLSAYFPKELNWKKNEWDDPFDGRIISLNW